MAREGVATSESEAVARMNKAGVSIAPMIVTAVSDVCSSITASMACAARCVLTEIDRDRVSLTAPRARTRPG